MSFANALGQIAPIYNLGFAIIVFYLFFRVFRTHARRKSRVYITPWIFVFVAFCIYVFEAVFTVLRKMAVVNIPVHINGFFELIIISLFIYALLLQKDYVKKHHM